MLISKEDIISIINDFIKKVCEKWFEEENMKKKNEVIIDFMHIE